MSVPFRGYRIGTGIVFTAPFISYVAHAEPGASNEHLVPLYFIIGIGAAFFAAIPLIIRQFSKTKQPLWQYIAASMALALGFALFAGPIIIIFGSIIATGRTM